MVVLPSIAAILIPISADIEFYSLLAFLTIFATKILLKFMRMLIHICIYACIHIGGGSAINSSDSSQHQRRRRILFVVSLSRNLHDRNAPQVFRHGCFRSARILCRLFLQARLPARAASNLRCVLPCIAVCCRVLQCVAVWCNMVQRDAMYSVL